MSYITKKVFYIAIVIFFTTNLYSNDSPDTNKKEKFNSFKYDYRFTKNNNDKTKKILKPNVSFNNSCQSGVAVISQNVIACSGNYSTSGSQSGVLGVPDIINSDTDVGAKRVAIFNSTSTDLEFSKGFSSDAILEIKVRRWSQAYDRGFTISLSEDDVTYTTPTSEFLPTAYMTGDYEKITYTVPSSLVGNYKYVRLTPINYLSFLLIDAVTIKTEECAMYQSDVFNDSGAGGGTYSNGIKDGTESSTGIPSELFVNVLDNAENIIYTAILDSNGLYQIATLPDGVYTVVLSKDETTTSSSLPSLWENSNNGSGTYTINVASGQITSPTLIPSFAINSCEFGSLDAVEYVTTAVGNYSTAFGTEDGVLGESDIVNVDTDVKEKRVTVKSDESTVLEYDSTFSGGITLEVRARRWSQAYDSGYTISVSKDGITYTTPSTEILPSVYLEGEYEIYSYELPTNLKGNYRYVKIKGVNYLSFILIDSVKKIDKQCSMYQATVFNDSGAGGGTYLNGIKDGTEGSADLPPELYINVLDSASNIVHTYRLDSNGQYKLPILADGTYTVVLTNDDTLKSNSLPNLWKNSNRGSGTYAITVASEKITSPSAIPSLGIAACEFGIADSVAYVTSAVGHYSNTYGTEAGILGVPDIVDSATDVKEKRLTISTSTGTVLEFSNTFSGGITLGIRARRWSYAYDRGYTVSVSKDGITYTTPSAEILPSVYLEGEYETLNYDLPRSLTGNYRYVKLSPINYLSFILIDSVKKIDEQCSSPPPNNNIDTDADGVNNSEDLDDDNDGCLDTAEETIGQQTTAEKVSIDTAPIDKTVAENTNTSFTVVASSISTTTYNTGTPDYSAGTNTTNSITYKWFKSSESSTILSTTNTLTLNNVQASNEGEYTVQVFGFNNSCPKEETVTLTLGSAPLYNPLSPAQCFNVFVESSITLKEGATGGSMATGGNLILLSNYNVASNDCGCFNVEGKKLGLLVGSKVTYPPNSSILNVVDPTLYAKIAKNNGSTVWYKNPDNESTPIRVVPMSDYTSDSYIQINGTSEDLNVSATNNPVFEENLLDFDLAFQQLRTNSISLSQNLNNASLEDNSGNSISNTGLPNDIEISLNDGVNYLNVTGIDLNNVQTFTAQNHPSNDKILVINIDATGSINWDVWQQLGVASADSKNIIYNFYNATELNINSSEEIYGTILAPFAAINKTNTAGNITGQVVGKLFTHNGGEIKCSNFNSQIPIENTTSVSPIAEFTVNGDNKCFENNGFVFTNTSNTGSSSQPSNPITYVWDFGDQTSSSLMNPVKSYAAAGVYTVKLTATNSFGSDTATKQITVLSSPDDPVIEMATIASNTPGTITRQFTLVNDTYFDSYTWVLESGDAGPYENQKVVTFDFTTEGTHRVGLIGIKNGCQQIKIATVVIVSEEVNGGNDGGVESESLGDAISKIYLKRKMSSMPTNFKKSKENRYNKQKLVSQQAYLGKGQTMLDMFPTELVSGDVSHVTSPTDILDYTVADEVLSVDFSVDDKTKGVVLGIKTSNKVYNHTKASCDRLRGAEILNIETVVLEGYNFLIQGIKQRNGVVEYAISFVVAKNENDANYTLQTNWYVHKFIAFNDVYNFQVWSTKPSDTQKLVSDILNNLKSYLPIQQSEVQEVPKTYASKVSRDKQDLVVLLKSMEEGLNVEISLEEKLNETSETLNLRYNPINTAFEQSLRLKINDGYEYDADVKFNGIVQDAFYHADGNWGLDYSKDFTTVNQYEVTNNPNRVYTEDELSINRNIHVKAYSEYDYLTVYKSLLPGTLSADYSDYNYLSFKAKGSGMTQLVLVKSSLENWGKQYKATVNLTDQEQTFFIPFDSFTSTASNAKIVADDLTTIAFTYIAVDAGTNDLDMKISDVKFTKKNTSLNVDEFITPMKNEFLVYPNPSKGKINCIIQSDFKTKATVSLYDVTGKEIYSSPVELTAGKNEIDFNVKVKPGIMFLKVNSKEINYGTSKIIFR